VRIDIWSDIVCPYCSLGKARFETALAAFPHRDEVEVAWHSFELDRHAEPVSNETLPEMIASKYGISHEQAEAQHVGLEHAAAEEGLTFAWREARPGNTHDAHRLTHLAADRGLQAEAVDRLMRAYFSEGAAIGDRDTLVRLGGEIGLPEDEVRGMLDSDDYGNHVRSDQATAKMIGIEGVPFFVLDRKFGVSGAQPFEVFSQALAQAWERRDEEPELRESAGCGGGCGNGACGTGACSA
jgi:predicted DsbA family dithiol-disulfide isomerase